MILSLKGQTIFFFQMVLTGAMIGVGYDVLRLCRTYFPLRGLLLQVEDFLFWLTALFFAFSRTVATDLLDLGGIRWFTILGVALGMVLYFGAFSPVLLPLARLCIRLMSNLILAILRPVFLPFYHLGKFVRKKCKKIVDFFIKIGKRCLHFFTLYGKMKWMECLRKLRRLRKK